MQLHKVIPSMYHQCLKTIWKGRRVQINATVLHSKERRPTFQRRHTSTTSPKREKWPWLSFEVFLCWHWRTLNARGSNLIILHLLPRHPRASSSPSQTTKRWHVEEMIFLKKIVWTMEAQPTFYDGLQDQDLMGSKPHNIVCFVGKEDDIDDSHFKPEQTLKINQWNRASSWSK